jgi:hypothetical protein
MEYCMRFAKYGGNYSIDSYELNRTVVALFEP